MKVGILADIHANLEAFEAVLFRLQGQVNRIVHLGDAVGYGPDPQVCLEILRRQGIPSVMGNHDRAACGLMEPTFFTALAQTALDWTRRQLTDGDKAVMAAWPLIQRDGDIIMGHGCFSAPERWDYVETPAMAQRELEHIDAAWGFLGHTHRPMAVSLDPLGNAQRMDTSTVDLEEGKRYLFNPGSVGQPRDGDARASAMILDLDARKATWIRVRYDISVTQRRMRDAKLPEPLITRLALGR